MLYDFYNKKIDAIFVSANYATLFGSDENYGTIGKEKKIIYRLYTMDIKIYIFW